LQDFPNHQTDLQRRPIDHNAMPRHLNESGMPPLETVQLDEIVVIRRDFQRMRRPTGRLPFAGRADISPATRNHP
jgi:hypothetical protein